MKKTRSHFKVSPQAQSLRWIEVANPQNPAKAGLLRVTSSLRLDLESDPRL